VEGFFLGSSRRKRAAEEVGVKERTVGRRGRPRSQVVSRSTVVPTGLAVPAELSRWTNKQNKLRVLCARLPEVPPTKLDASNALAA